MFVLTRAEYTPGSGGRRADAAHVNEFFGLPGTNRHITFRIARLMDMDDQGLITNERRIYDFTGLLVQIGVLRAKPAKP